MEPIAHLPEIMYLVSKMVPPSEIVERLGHSYVDKKKVEDLFFKKWSDLRPAIPRRLWGRHITYIASPKSPWLAGRLNS